MNKVILLGRLTRDPEVRTGDKSNVARYTLAVNRSYKREGEPEADFFNVTAFGARADFAGKYFSKGRQVAIVGELRNNSYTDKDGNKRYTTDIIVSEQYFADSKPAGNGNAAAPAAPPATPAEPSYTAPPDVDIEGDDDLPF